jgi:hypothetical protein
MQMSIRPLETAQVQPKRFWIYRALFSRSKAVPYKLKGSEKKLMSNFEISSFQSENRKV